MSVGRDGASDAVSFLRVGHPGGRVRARRRRPPRPRGVGLGLLAGQLPAGARRLRHASFPSALADGPARPPSDGTSSSDRDDEPDARRRHPRRRRRRARPSEPAPATEPSRRGERAPDEPDAEERARGSTDEPTTEELDAEELDAERRREAEEPELSRREPDEERRRPEPTSRMSEAERRPCETDDARPLADQRGRRARRRSPGCARRTAEHAAEARRHRRRGRAPATPRQRPRRRRRAGEPRPSAGRGDQPRGRRVAAAGPRPPSRPRRWRAEERSRRARLWARFLAASFLIVVSMATATAVSLLVYLDGHRRGLWADSPAFRDQLESRRRRRAADDPDPRLRQAPGVEDDTGRSDTTMLLRVDAGPERIALLSLPRDLKVNIPGHGIDKLNEAYAYGGPKLTLEASSSSPALDDDQPRRQRRLQRLRRRRQRDRLRLRRRRPPLLPLERRPGGRRAVRGDRHPGRLPAAVRLQRAPYVRYRHDDNDLVRAARQQDFLREARQKVPPEKLARRPQRADRHLHQVHDLGHRGRGRRCSSAAEAVHRGARRAGRPDRVPGEPRRRRARPT